MALGLDLFDLDGVRKQARDPYVYLRERLGTLDASQPLFEKAFQGTHAVPVQSSCP
jgi:hypothetical protein